jgi:hypothetical protein
MLSSPQLATNHSQNPNPPTLLPSPVHYFTDFLLVSLELNSNSVASWDNRIQRVFQMLKKLTLTATAVFVRGFLMTNTLPSLTSAKLWFDDAGYRSESSADAPLQVNPRFKLLKDLSITFPLCQAGLSVFALFVDSPLDYLSIIGHSDQWQLYGVSEMDILKVLSQFRSHPEYIDLSIPCCKSSDPHLILNHLNLHRTKRLKITSNTMVVSGPPSWRFLTVNRAPVLKELILNGDDNEHILPYLSLEADQLERLEINNRHGDMPMERTSSPYIPIFPSLRHIQYDHGTHNGLIPYLLESAPNLFTLFVRLGVHHEATLLAELEDLTWWLAPRTDGTITAPYLKTLHIKVTGSRYAYYNRQTHSSVLVSVNTLLSARGKAGAGQYPNITISWEDDPGEQLCWEDGQLVFPSSVPPVEKTLNIDWLGETLGMS